MILVTVPKTESAPSRSFSITGTFYSVVQKYAALRPPNTKDSRFFIHYHQGECNMQPIGKNKFYDMSRKVAKYLRLSEPETYTGTLNPRHKSTDCDNNSNEFPGLSFRRASGISGANNGGYYSNSVAEEDTEFTLDYEPGPIEASAISCTKPYVSAARNMNINSTGRLNECATSHMRKSICCLCLCYLKYVSPNNNLLISIFSTYMHFKLRSGEVCLRGK